MADEDELDGEDEDGEDVDDDGDQTDKKGGSKKMIIIIAAILSLVIGGVAAAYFTGLLNPLIGGTTEENAEEDTKKALMQVVFFPLEEIVVNLGSGGRNSSFLKVRVNLELESSADIPKIETVLPRIMDKFQVYLRELRMEDLKGSAGMYRLREELLSRVNSAAAPTKVNDVLFKEMLIQ